MGISEAFYQKVHMYVVNPKAVSVGQLYGEVDLFTNEWHDGLLSSIIRHAFAVSICIYFIINSIINNMS